MADAGDVDPARGDVSRDQDRRFRGLELGERALALRLALIAVDRVGRNALLAELLHHPVSTVLGAGEDQHTLEPARHLVALGQHQFEQRLLLVGLDHEQVLVDPLGGCSRGRHADMDRIVAILAHQLLDRLRHGGAEKQRLALVRHQFADLAQRVNEAKVEHLVGLVEDEDFDVAELERLLVDQVEQPARRRDEDIGAAMQLVAVLADRGAADDRMDLEPGHRAVILRRLGDLPGQLARRRKHQHAARLERRAVVGFAQAIDGRQHEGCGLAGPGLRDAEQVAALEHRRDRLRLDRRRGVVALEVKRLEHGLRQPELGESGCHFGCIKLAIYAARSTESAWNPGAARVSKRPA